MIKKILVKTTSNSSADAVYSLIYMMVLLWLSIGFVPEASLRDLLLFSVYGFFFVAATCLLLYLKMVMAILTRLATVDFSSSFPYLDKVISVVVVSVVAMHYFYLGSVPVVEAMMVNDKIEIALIRQSASEHLNVFLAYASSITVLSVMPFLTLFFYIKKSRLFFCSVALSLFYAISLMQKSYVLAVLLPMVVYALTSSKPKLAAKFFLISCMAIAFLVLVTNPGLRPTLPGISTSAQASQIHAFPGEAGDPSAFSSNEDFNNGFSAVAHRILMVPGLVVSQWFKVIPADIPYAHGCGYRLLSNMIGCEHANFPRLVWSIYYENMARQGLSGTANAASFMEDYGNFGVIGLTVSGIVLAFWFCFIGTVFRERRAVGLALNVGPILYLSSSALSSLLVSGGWLVTILLFLMSRHQFDSAR